MSFFGYDLLDGHSIANFVSDDEESLGDAPSLSSTSRTPNQGTTTNDIEVSSPPLMIEMNSHDDIDTLAMSDEDSVSGGVTILSSASSSSPFDLALMRMPHPSPPPVIAAATFPFMFPYYAGPQHLSTDHALSISTTESLFAPTTQDPPAHIANSALDQSNSRSSCLSLQAYSLASSCMTDISLPSVEDSALSPPPGEWVTVDHSDAIHVENKDIDQGNQAQPKSWYEALWTDEDWEGLADCALQVLTALSRERSEAGMTPEEMLGLLIQAEEQQFWQQQQRGGILFSKWRRNMVDLALVIAAVATASVGARMALHRHLLLTFRS